MGNGEQASSIRLYRVCEAYDMARNITIMRFFFCEKGHKSSVTTLTERAFDVPVYGVLCAVVWHTRGTPCR